MVSCFELFSVSFELFSVSLIAEMFCSTPAIFRTASSAWLYAGLAKTSVLARLNVASTAEHSFV